MVALESEFDDWISFSHEHKLYRNDVLIRPAVPDDISAMVHVNAKSIESHGSEGLFMPMSASFFSDVIYENMSIVLQERNEVVGYSIAVPVGMRHKAFTPSLNSDRLGLFFGTALLPRLTRQGWQSWLIKLRLASFKAAGFTEIQCTVSPFNKSSLINLVDNGFQIVALKLLLDNFPRFVGRYCFGHQMSGMRSVSFSDDALIPITDNLSDHEKYLSREYIGVEIQRGDPLVVRYIKSGKKD